MAITWGTICMYMHKHNHIQYKNTFQDLVTASEIKETPDAKI